MMIYIFMFICWLFFSFYWYGYGLKTNLGVDVLEIEKEISKFNNNEDCPFLENKINSLNVTHIALPKYTYDKQTLTPFQKGQSYHLFGIKPHVHYHK